MPDRIPTILQGMEDLTAEIRALRGSSNRQRVLTRLLIIVIALMLLAGGWFGLLLYWPNTPLVFKTLTVASGQSVTGPLNYHTSYCRTNTGTATVSRNVTGVGSNHNTYPGPPVSSISHVGCGSANIPLPLPPGVKPGRYVLTIQADFTVHTSPLRVVSVRAISNQFTLVP